MQQSADKKRKEMHYQGDWVYLKLNPYRQQILAKTKFEILVGRYYSPY